MLVPLVLCSADACTFLLLRTTWCALVCLGTYDSLQDPRQLLMHTTNDFEAMAAVMIRDNSTAVRIVPNLKSVGIALEMIEVLELCFDAGQQKCASGDRVI